MANQLESSWWAGEVKRILGKKQPLCSACLHALRDEDTRTLEPARAFAAEPLSARSATSSTKPTA